MRDKLPQSEAEWREILDDDTYYVTRQKGTERPFTGQYNAHFEAGTYRCACCGQPLFDSGSKFDAGCGWPSFHSAIAEGAVDESTDTSHGMVRTEILCSHCGAHLGHVFPDGPLPTGLRYCVNSLSLNFLKDGDKS